MPTYEYQCDSCGYRFEQLQKITEDALKTCPSCGKDSLKRLVSATAFHLKGGGWYKTDYSPSSSSSSSSNSSNSNSTSSNSSSPSVASDTSKDSNPSNANTNTTPSTEKTKANDTKPS